jgi:hypothetical protein
MAFGPVGGDVILVAAEFQDVPLRDAQVFEQHPWGVGKAWWFLTAKFLGNSGDNFVKFCVGIAAF